MITIVSSVLVSPKLLFISSFFNKGIRKNKITPIHNVNVKGMNLFVISILLLIVNILPN